MKEMREFALIFFASLAVAVGPSWGDETHSQEQSAEHEEEGGAVGPEKGVIEFHSEDGLRLSPEATKNFGITVKEVVSTKYGIEIPAKSILESQNEKYVYVEKSGLLKRIAIKIDKKTADTILLKRGPLSPKDKVVISGVPFIRAAELDVTSGGGSHGH